MNKQTKSRVLWGVAILVPVALIAWIMSLPKIPEDEILSRAGVHWHAELSIVVNGEKVNIPANIGIPVGIAHPSNMHTHAEDNVIHIEVGGIVKKDDARLKNFFEQWEKDFTKDAILGNAATGSSTLTMRVNGIDNTEFENYVLRDGDKIEIVYGTQSSPETAGTTTSPAL